MEHIIEVDDVTFGYEQDRPVISDISFVIDEPEFICVIGPNGVGKSTLIKCLNGLIKPTEGEVRVLGRNVRDYKLKELAQVVGYVPVMTGDFNVMTVLDTVLLGRYSKQKWRTTEDDIDISYKALEVMEIEDLAMRNFNELSAGQHQKVAIARGLVQEPKVLILDEPTSNLDIRHQMYVSSFLKKLSALTGIAVVMISHDLNLAAKYADRIIVMEPPGRIYGIGTPHEMITSEMISRVYKVRSEIVDDHGTPHIMLESVEYRRPVDLHHSQVGERHDTVDGSCHRSSHDDIGTIDIHNLYNDSIILLNSILKKQ